MSEIVELEVVMDDGSVRKAFGKIQGAGTDAAASIDKSFSVVTKTIASIVGTLAAGFGLKKIVEAGEESAVAWRNFSLALASTGQFSKEAARSFEEYASGLQKITGVQDEVIASGAAMLLNVGRISAEALPRATKAALDLAAALPQVGGPDGAFNLLSKAAAGSTTTLGRFGIHIDENLKKSEKFAAVLNLIEKNFNGMAQANLGTFAGMQKFAQLGFGEIVEQLGLIVVRSPAVIALMKMVGEGMFELAKRISNLGGGKDPLRPLIMGILDFGRAVTQYVIPPFEMLYNVGSVVFKDFIAGLNGIAFAAGTVGQGVIMILQAVGIEISNKLINDVNSFTEKATQGVAAWTQSAEDSMMKLDNTPVSTSMNAFIDTMDAVVAKSSEMQAAYSQNVTNMSGATSAFVDESVAKLKQMNEAVTRTIVHGISGAVQSMVKNLHSGKGAFDDFGSMIMNLIGDVAIQIGEFFLLTGTGLIALLSNPLTAGFTTVAMGLALIGFGALMKSMSGGGPSFAGGGGFDSGGGVSSTPDTTAQIETEQAKPKTDVTVVVQGNVFDRRETGLYIAEIINDNFDINGTKLSTGAG